MKLLKILVLSSLLICSHSYAAQDTPLDEVRSQATHALIGFVPTALLGPIGIPIVAVWVYSWENSQHPGECNKGCQRDVAFYTIGAMVGIGVH